jgi:hypothetical protein
MTKKFMGIALFVCLISMVAAAQELPKPEVFGGYQFTSLDSGWHGSGWNGAANMYVTRWMALTGDFSGVYGSGSNLTTYTFGPTFSTRRHAISPFAHALFGGAHASSAGLGDSGMAMMFGGGVDAGSKKLAFRAVQVDWMMLRFNGFTDKNNLRISTGALYRF